jgi:quercetin dioxygenase-like cupin family protein
LRVLGVFFWTKQRHLCGTKEHNLAKENHRENTNHPRRSHRRCRHRHYCRSTWRRRKGYAALRADDNQHSRKSLVALVVDYAPGGASPSHVHAKSAFIFAYVLSGEVESQVNDEPKRVYRAGESWYETPGSHHRVSRNASATQPAKLLAVVVADTDEKELPTPSK